MDIMGKSIIARLTSIKNCGDHKQIHTGDRISNSMHNDCLPDQE